MGSLDSNDRAAVKRGHEDGRLVRLLPGTYVRAQHVDDLALRMAAVGLWSPDAVVTGEAAAHVTFWPSVPVDEVEVAIPERAPRGLGYRFRRRRIDRDFVCDLGGVEVSSPALTAVDLVERYGGDSIDTCLRSRAATLSELWAAHRAHPNRAGNAERERLLHDSRDEPWSGGERYAHRLLRRSRISGWRTNFPVTAGRRRYYIDIAFPHARLAIEIDGRIHDRDQDTFENDRRRQNDLVGAGWVVLRFTWDMLVNDPAYVIATIRAYLSAA